MQNIQDYVRRTASAAKQASYVVAAAETAQKTPHSCALPNSSDTIKPPSSPPTLKIWNRPRRKV